MKKKTGGGKGHTSKHAGSKKHAAAGAKHHPRHEHLTAEGRKDLQQAGAHTKGKHHHHPRGLAVGDLLPACAFEAVAMSLRLAGQPVGDDEVAWLWELAGSREVSIAEALDAAARFGLAGCRSGMVRELHVPHRAVQQHPELGTLHGGEFQGLDDSAIALLDSDEPAGTVLLEGYGGHAGWGNGHGLILGVDLPGPHAVLAVPDGWWSWGELWTPWTTAISEAWVISWL